jgi:tetratricopeptide (TPR) repeat protein
MTRTLLFVFVVAVAAPLFAAPTPEQRKVAREHYSAAVTHFNLGEYADAAEEFRAVYKISPQPVILYDAAQSYRLANRSAEALTLYESFLRESPNAPVRAEVERRIAELRGKKPGDHVEATDPKTGETKSTDPKSEVTTTKTTTTKVTTSPSGTTSKTLATAPDASGGSERLKPVAEIIKANRAGFRACFDTWSAKNPGVAGKVKLTFYLDPDGQLNEAEAETNGFKSDEVSACIENYAGTLKYPKSSGGKFTRFSYPFDFKPH